MGSELVDERVKFINARLAELLRDVQTEIDVATATGEQFTQAVEGMRKRAELTIRDAQICHDNLHKLANQISEQAPDSSVLARIVCDHLSGLLTQAELMRALCESEIESGYLEPTS